MKKIFLLLSLCFLCIGSSIQAQTFPVGSKLFLKPNLWNVDGARFAAYFFGDGGNTWTDATATSPANDTYQIIVPTGEWTTVIFCRMNGTLMENNWTNKWNQSPDVPYSAGNNTYNVTDWADGAWIAPTNYSETLASADLTNYGANALQLTNGLTINNAISNEQLATLKTALGANTTINSITIEGDVPTNWAENYFAACTANPTVTINADITLADKATTNLPYPLTMGAGKTISYTREAYTDGGWETIILPFDAAVPANFKVEKYIDKTGETLNFETATSMEANTAYIMKYTGTPEAALSTQEITFTGTVAQTASITSDFSGVYAPEIITAAGNTEHYILQADGTSFALVTTLDVTVEPFRASLDIISPSSAPVFYSIDHNGEGGTTGVSATPTTTSLETVGIEGGIRITAEKAQTVQLYTVIGQLITIQNIPQGESYIMGLAKGMYLLNNNKVIVK